MNYCVVRGPCGYSVVEYWPGRNDSMFVGSIKSCEDFIKEMISLDQSNAELDAAKRRQGPKS